MEIIPLPAFDDNYIWVVCNAQQQIAIIDPGDAEPVLTAIDQHGWQPSAILLTHHHYDHTGGVAELAERYQLPIYGPASESIPLVTHPLVEGETLDAACRRVETVIERLLRRTFARSVALVLPDPLDRVVRWMAMGQPVGDLWRRDSREPAVLTVPLAGQWRQVVRQPQPMTPVG